MTDFQVLETEVRPSDVVCAINTDDVMVQDVISEKNESFHFGKGFKVVGMHFMVMDAGTRDALEAEKSVDGFNIAQEAGEWKATIFHPYLPSHAYLTCRFFSARKHGLMDELFCDS
uniref:Uncharacterized protein n=1 Tax=Lactuca sativa TaxID=4236 RepID=A0A9R1X106_LACSA|nr:hypothetical protein LSAT_V11C800404570 [Lactuca sativa]